ncbi:MAG: phosphotransferase family protein [Thermodesulfobacteriota bacterium]
MALAEKLESYLSGKLGTQVRVTSLARKSGGASRETYLFDAAWQEDGRGVQRGYVLRRDPVASVLESDRTLEYRVLEGAAALGIPVPKVCWLELSTEPLERPFFVMERVDGTPTPPSFPPAYPAEMRARTASDFVSILARIHAADWRRLELDVLDDPGPGTEAARRAVTHWRRVFEQDRVEAQPVLERGFAWLERNLPATEHTTLVHGDYRSGNYLHLPDGRITAMLDWEMAHLGDPHEDLGWATMPYWSSAGRAGGLEETDEMLARYERASGTKVDRERVHFYQVLGTVKMAVISLTGVRSLCEGRSADPTLAVVGLLLGRLSVELLRLLGVGPAGGDT